MKVTDLPASYVEARDTFRAAADLAGAQMHAYPLPIDPDLTIDVAILRPGAANYVVVSSGVHGVEGPVGSAVQTNWIRRIDSHDHPSDVGVVLIHAVNPFGFAHDRRWNEDNVDLNRNFMLDADSYRGAADGYRKIEPLLNPKSVPSRWEPFVAKAFWNIAKFGLPAIKDAIAKGQYEFPDGLFFGGKQATASTRIVCQHYRSWVSSATEVTHLDLHTGLGRHGEHRFLMDVGRDDPAAKWFRSLFGDELVEPSDPRGTSYEALGTFGRWARHEMRDSRFRFATIDFGTYGLIRVLAALRAENRVFHNASDPSQFEWVRTEVRESFCPTSSQWRQKVVAEGTDIINKSVAAMS